MPPTFAIDALGSAAGAYYAFLTAWLAFCCASWVLLRYPTLLHRRKPRKGAFFMQFRATRKSARSDLGEGFDHVHVDSPLIHPSNQRIPSANDPRFQATHIAHRGCRLEGRQGGRECVCPIQVVPSDGMHKSTKTHRRPGEHRRGHEARAGLRGGHFGV